MDNFDILNVGNARCIEPYMYGADLPYPGITGIVNIEEAIRLLEKHNKKETVSFLHCDVDVDGMGNGYIAKKFFGNTDMGYNAYYIINKERKHGIDFEKVNNINNYSPDLVIILDSSSSNIEEIEMFNCDVIVVDHHELEIGIEDLTGRTLGGEYVIVTNMALPNDENQSHAMSGCMVLYDLLREYASRIGLGEVFDHLKLDQWVAITLYSDVVSLQNNRNQWFINRLLLNKGLENGIDTITDSLRVGRIDKTTVNFKISPLINSTVRGGESKLALNMVLENQRNINELEVFRDRQKEIMEIACEDLVEEEYFIYRDITDTDIPPAYAGVIASRISNERQMCAFVFRRENGKCIGSFRGKDSMIDYRSALKNMGALARGHKGAFGLEIVDTYMISHLNKACCIEYTNDKFISMGLKYGGIYHIDSMLDFKRSQNLIKLALLNSRSTSMEEINIVYLGSVELVEEHEKYRIYSVDGLECVAFEEIVTNEKLIYVEFTNEVRAYIRNLR